MRQILPYLDARHEQLRFLLLHPFVDRVHIVAIDFNLLHHGERDGVFERAKLADLGVSAGLLTAKLITREAEDREAAAVVLLVQLLEARILARKAALGRDIDDEDDAPLERAHVVWLPRRRVDLFDTREIEAR